MPAVLAHCHPVQLEAMAARMAELMRNQQVRLESLRLLPEGESWLLIQTEIMARTGIDARRLDSGCCGLAGNIGFEAGHYKVSMACAEQALLPAVRAADTGTLVLADGFSCRTQIEQPGTGRRAIHLAEALAGAPGQQRNQRPPASRSGRGRGALVAVTVTAGAGVLADRRWLR